MDAGESPLQAAERETKEEAGLDKNDFEHLDKFEEKITYNVNGRPKDVFYYLLLQDYFPFLFIVMLFSKLIINNLIKTLSPIL